ncbi:MAG: hypothetical protein H0V01_13420 [Bacteroidetes bacterium]|nr:hypothetical protein [Bacteroidota bacterium]HET6245481.1 hypothetical protein [Bacteroidia bacterium]
MKKISIVAVFALLVSCVSVKLAIPTQEDVDRANKFPDYTLADLNLGKAHFEQKCGSCHGLKKPTSRTEEQWNKIVPRMVHKANKKTLKIDEGQQELILKYLVTMSSAPKKK